MKPETRDYVKALFGKVSPGLELMDRYLPGYLDGNYAKLRSFYPHPTKDRAAAIPEKYRYLMCVAIELATERGGGQGQGNLPGVMYAKTAVRKGGSTVREVAETVAIAAYLCGQTCLLDYGLECIKAADEEYRKMHGNSAH